MPVSENRPKSISHATAHITVKNHGSLLDMSSYKCSRLTANRFVYTFVKTSRIRSRLSSGKTKYRQFVGKYSALNIVVNLATIQRNIWERFEPRLLSSRTAENMTRLTFTVSIHWLLRVLCIRSILLANVNSSSCSLYVIDGPSVVCRLSSVCRL